MKMGGPRHTTGVAEGVAILICQTTVSQRFEHLAAKKDWPPEKVARWQECPPYALAA